MTCEVILRAVLDGESRARLATRIVYTERPPLAAVVAVATAAIAELRPLLLASPLPRDAVVSWVQHGDALLRVAPWTVHATRAKDVGQ